MRTVACTKNIVASVNYAAEGVNYERSFVIYAHT